MPEDESLLLRAQNINMPSSRFMIALLLLLIYVLVTMAPLAPLVLESPRLAYAGVGESEGDCDSCGCSSERRANHTCCCCIHKKKAPHGPDRENVPECCRKNHRGGESDLTCNCPCGSGKQLGSSGTGKWEHLPHSFTTSPAVFEKSPLVSFHRNRLNNRRDEPPDPPPKLTFLS